ncbi:Crp/Fnr family transcriptional regulator [Crassaminicella profunda]|uniref:Crp/Fnr family transcriptional regulator n=1 Tax=Crassaminicella profunda TaxID=1286698 RepID=UPI001CA73338|nr:cyclic nucleotide-binding domain-containing protein [Crassaminicella profunda]QZY56425.1 cyclic nucleotide-binding domain-containing protein [Crassaminicella profunda]
MKKIINPKLLDYYKKKYHIDDIFDDEVLSFMELHHYEKGEKILQAKNELIYYYFFVEGKIKIFSLLENGKSLLLEFYTEFDTLGDVELFKNLSIRSDVEAVKNSYLIGIPANILREKCHDNIKFLRFMIDSLSIKLESTSNNSSYNLLYPLINRLSSYLLEHITDKDYIILNSSFKDISEFLGTTYRHLHRTFTTLQSKGIIKYHGQTVYILNKNELKKLSKNLYR